MLNKKNERYCLRGKWELKKKSRAGITPSMKGEKKSVEWSKTGEFRKRRCEIWDKVIRG